MPVVSVVLLNGPPGSGKDTAGRALKSALLGVRLCKLAGALKRATHELYGIRDMADDAFEDRKNKPMVLFRGLTPRQAYIRVSEELVKPHFGADHFGRVLAQQIRQEAGMYRTFVVTDSGFAEEAAPIVQVVGPENVLLVRLHADGRGCSFAGDSRGHIDLPGVRSIDITNDEDEAGFATRVVGFVSAWLADRSARS